MTNIHRGRKVPSKPFTPRPPSVIVPLHVRRQQQRGFPLLACLIVVIVWFRLLTLNGTHSDHNPIDIEAERQREAERRLRILGDLAGKPYDYHAFKQRSKETRVPIPVLKAWHDALHLPRADGELIDVTSQREAFTAAMDNDLDTQSAIQALDGLAKQIQEAAKTDADPSQAQTTLRELGGVLGLVLDTA